MTRFLLAAAAAALLAVGAHAQPFGGQGMRGSTDFDLNHDGKVTLDEFRQAQSQRIDRIFERLDSNHDGKITRDEMQTAAAQSPRPGGGRMGGRGERMFQMNDTDGDGALTKAEMMAAAMRRFQVADVNHDGWLSKDELAMMRPRVRGGR